MSPGSLFFGIAGSILWIAFGYWAGIWTRRHSTLREVMETVAHGAVIGLIAIVALRGLPQQPCGAATQYNAAEGQQDAGNAGLMAVSADLVSHPDALAVRMVNPLPKANQDAAEAEQQQRFAQGGIASQCCNANDQRDREVGQRAVPLVGRQALQLVHAANHAMAVRP